jgi:hypothetical protein
MPEPLAPDANLAAIDRLKACAAMVRAAADDVDRAVHDLAAFDRPDVWQGGRATDFRHGLEQQQAALSAPDHGAVARLREAARRIEVRAELLHVDGGVATADARTGPR